MIELITVYFNGQRVYTVLGEFLQILRLIPSKHLSYFTWDRKPTQLKEIHSDAKINELKCRINSIVRHILENQPFDNPSTKMFCSWYNIPTRRKLL